MSNSAVPNPINNVGNILVQDDEIDLNELFSKIWRRRKFIVSFVALVLIVVLGVISLLYLFKAPVKSYSMSLRFNFPTSIQGKYPSGQRFSKNDLITTVVLKQVYDSNNVEGQGLEFEDFAASFTVAPYASNAKFIQQKYEKILADKKLSRTDIEAIEKQYENEMKLAQANFARVSYVDTLHLGLSSTIIEKILSDIPKVWSEISIRDLGVLDLKIPGKQFYQPGLVEQYEYLQAVQYMQDSARRFETMLTVLQADDMGGFVRDPKTDLVVSDLLARLESIKRFDLGPMYSIVASLGLVKNKEKAQLYLSNQIDFITDEMAELKRKASVYKDAMSLYAVAQGRQGRSGEKIPSRSDSLEGMGMVQYGDGFLSKVVSMVEEQKDTEYRQSLLNNQVNYAVQVQERTTELENLKRALKVLKNNNLSSSGLVSDYAARITSINKEIAQLVAVYQRILERRNAQSLGKNSALYEQASIQMQVESGLSSKLKRVLILSIVFAFLALMIGVIIALLVKEKNQPHHAE